MCPRVAFPCGMRSSGSSNRRRFLKGAAMGAGAVTLGTFVPGAVSTQLSDALVIGETGIRSIDQPDRSTWHSVEFSQELVNTLSSIGAEAPIVTMKPPSYNDPEPCHIRLRNVTQTGCDFQIEEWDHADGSHQQESVFWLAIAPGVYEIQNASGTVFGVEATATSVSNSPQDVTFTFEFDQRPVVVAQSQTQNGKNNSINTRFDVADNEAVNVRVQEQETELYSHRSYHRTERVGYIAIEQSAQGVLDDLGLTGVLTTPFEANRPDQKTGDSPGEATTYSFKRNDYEIAPRTVAACQTRRGPEPAELRRTGIGLSEMSLFAEEETSFDDETNHAGEDIGYIAFGGDGMVPGLSTDISLR